MKNNFKLNLNKCAIIIPVYNEEHRIDCLYIKELMKLDLKIIFVNDGSTDRTSLILKTLSYNGRCQILTLDKNKGKSNAISVGLEYAADKFSWVGYLDIDKPCSPSELKIALDTIMNKSFNYDVLWAIRDVKLKHYNSKTKYRYFVHYLFRFLLKSLYGANIPDISCGLKIFRSSVALKIIQEKFISSWIFDLEIFLKLDKKKLYQYKLATWSHSEGSNIYLRDLLKLQLDLIRIIHKY